VPLRTEVLMGTLVTIQALDPRADQAIDRAFGWFHEVEDRCTRFDQRSELMQLTAQVGVPCAASPIVFEAVRFALRVADESGGAFDPTVGARMHARGFNREHRTGVVVPQAERHSPPASSAGGEASYRDVDVDAAHRTITVRRPLTLDLGAVAKGLAIDTAARELQPLVNFGIDAGGDLYLGGTNAAGTGWSVGIRHPRIDGDLIDALRVSDLAVCTSGDYERRSPLVAGGHHILDPRSGDSADAVASVTVVAPSAMLADALATAAFVLGPHQGIAFLERQGIDGMIFTATLDRHETGGIARLRIEQRVDPAADRDSDRDGAP
jgi:thiamine biosynthesis lipoprotein